jgi:tetratricopeptide (TPR) repeat protein
MADEPSQQTPETPAPGSGAVQVPQNVKNLHNKALAALERDNIDFAIEIFLKCVEMAPAYLAARRNLRLAEIAKFKRARKGSIAHQLSSLVGLPKKWKVQGLLKAKKPYEALMAAEQLLMIDPLNVGFGPIYADAAVAADQPDAAVMTLEIMREHSPANIDVVENLGRLYHKIKNYRAARECLEKVFVLKPTNTEVAKLLKDAEALATLDSGWEEAHREGKTYQSVLANKDQAVQLERAAKAVKTTEDADSLIAEARAKIEAEPNNLNYYLNLGSLFLQQKRFDDAIDVYLQAQKVNAADPELDRRLNGARVSKFDAEIAALREAGDTAGADAKDAARNQYVFDELSERVQRYPNDLRLRYELGSQYFQYQYYDEAIQQFQLAQRSPKDRVQALYHLALCFRAKGLLDMASMQLEQALEALPSMNPEKMDVMYVLAELYQEEGKLDDAARIFKEIYRVDVTFKNIAKKIEGIYAAQKAAAGK